ncbi:MAG: WD40/YVTN/BNR-like repeat-containing protein, partial [Bacteroidota bacterium]
MKYYTPIQIFFILFISGIASSCFNTRHAKENPGLSNEPVNFERLHKEKVESSHLVTWKQFGPGTSGYCEIVEYHPTDPECIMMSPDMFNTYGSWNNGYTWKSVKDDDGDGGDMLRIRDYSFSVTNPDFGMALDYNARLWITRDKGHSWEKGDFIKKQCSAIEINPKDKDIAFIGGGDFWHVKSNRRTYNNPHHKNKKADYGKIWRSNDGGKTWVLKNKGIPEDADIGKIRFHPSMESVVYAATSHGLYKSEDLGESWQDIGKALPHNIIRDMDFYYDEEGESLSIIVIDQVFWEPDGKGSVKSVGGVYKTTNEGDSWECLNSNLYLNLQKMSDDVQFSFYVALSRWFETSRDEIRDIYPVLPERALHNFNRLLINPINPDIIYLGH